MADYITLLGAEKVASAASQIASAADSMRKSVGNLDDVLLRHRMFMDDWLQRLEATLSARAIEREIKLPGEE